MDRLDAELEDMYAEYKARSERRAVATLREAEDDGPMSKKKKRATRIAAIETPEETAEQLAR